jgi:predicted nucleotidyltransferase
MKFGLKPEVIKKIECVFQSYPGVEKVLLYGSRAKENFYPGSDIDLTLVGKNLTASTRNKIAADLDDLNTPYLIDLSIHSKISSENLQGHIERVGKIVYQKHRII